MAIKELFNSIDGASKKATESISSFFGPVHYQAPTPQQSVASSYRLNDRGVDISDDDIKAIRPLVYGEISNRTADKKEMEANVIFNTALNRMKEYNSRGKKKTLSDVISMPNQYQAYQGKQYQAYHNPPDVVAAAKKKEVDAILDKILEQVKSGQYSDNTQGAYYYVHNPDGTITYDNKRQLFAK